VKRWRTSQRAAAASEDRLCDRPETGKRNIRCRKSYGSEWGRAKVASAGRRREGACTSTRREWGNVLVGKCAAGGGEQRGTPLGRTLKTETVAAGDQKDDLRSGGHLRNVKMGVADGRWPGTIGDGGGGETHDLETSSRRVRARAVAGRDAGGYAELRRVGNWTR